MTSSATLPTVAGSALRRANLARYAGAQFPPRIRFNHGYHDARCDRREGRGADGDRRRPDHPRTVAAPFFAKGEQLAYRDGYLYGWESAEEEQYSTAAWRAYSGDNAAE